MTMHCRGIRGATVAAANTAEELMAVTHELLKKMIEANGVVAEDVACVLFTTTPDLNAEFPAAAARKLLEWSQVALLCGQEIDVPGRMPRCVRVLMLVNTERRASEMVHVYLRGTEKLRDDKS